MAASHKLRMMHIRITTITIMIIIRIVVVIIIIIIIIVLVIVVMVILTIIMKIIIVIIIIGTRIIEKWNGFSECRLWVFVCLGVQCLIAVLGMAIRSPR